MSFQAVAKLSNSHRLCIGEITTAEAESAMIDNPEFNGNGVYLVKVDARSPKEPGEVLAKFATEDAAKELAMYLWRTVDVELA